MEACSQSVSHILEAIRAQHRVPLDRKTRNEWDLFGLKGMSGAIFLNKLVKYLPDEEDITEKLQQAVLVPSSEADAREKLHGLMKYLDEQIEGGVATGAGLQPNRAPESSPFLVETIHGSRLFRQSSQPLAPRRLLALSISLNLACSGLINQVVLRYDVATAVQDAWHLESDRRAAFEPSVAHGPSLPDVTTPASRQARDPLDLLRRDLGKRRPMAREESRPRKMH
ncbi:MAG: hypothetical protein BMS9Abin37_0271 [Acidobacteriota bacterium]|nr:MAG: hypothetical protein BMS9Abin37_0271 [Acidobacteriota bacterium]